MTICSASITLGLTSCGFYQAAGTTVYSNDVYQAGYEAGMAANAHINYQDACEMAAYLSDKMAYELGLSAAQYDAVYEINLDYLLSINGRDNLYSSYWSRRNSDLFYVLTASQYNRFVGMEYFYRPVYWSHNAYAYRFYTHYNDRNHYYYHRPRPYEMGYRGGNNKKKVSHYKDFNRNVARPMASGTTNHGRPYESRSGNFTNPRTGNNKVQPHTTTTTPAKINNSTVTNATSGKIDRPYVNDNKTVVRPSTGNITQPATNPTTRPAATHTSTVNNGRLINTPAGNPNFSGSRTVVNRPAASTTTRQPQMGTTRQTESTSSRANISTGNKTSVFGGNRSLPRSASQPRANTATTQPTQADTSK